MKIFSRILFLMVFLFQSFPGYAEDVVKYGWNFGALPAISFDSDLGVQYGAVVNLFDYGDGSRYPNYNHSLYFEVSRYTKGSGVYSIRYDSDQLFPGIQISSDLSYLPDLAYDFYGFNGYEAIYNPEWTDDSSNEYISRMYYKYDNKQFRANVDLEGRLIGQHIKWIAGIKMMNFRIAPVNLDKLNKGKSGDDILPDVEGLYEKYLDWGIISENEANGGFVPSLKAGLVYDTRDNKSNPTKGIWDEISMEVSPEFLGSESSFNRLSIYHRQYFSLIPEKLTLAIRFNYQTSFAGHVPFYYQNQVISSVMRFSTSEGLGGASTIRGALRNRIVGDGYFLGNLETRWEITRFSFINNNFYFGLVGFTDFGQVTKKIKVDPKVAFLPSENGYFDEGAEKMHITYGAGFRVGMNENFIVRIDYGRVTDKRDGTSGIYMGLNYLF